MKQPRILIVDDDESQLKTLSELLSAEGFSVECSADPARALRLLEAGGFQVAVLDLRLPQISGVELLRRACEASPSTRVIINTAFGSFSSAKEALNLGAFAYIEKLSAPTELIHAVHRAVEAHLSATLNESEQRFARLFDQGICGIVLLDNEQKIIDANLAFCGLVRYSPEQLLGKDFLDLVHPDHLATDLYLSEPNFRVERKLVTKNGETVWLDFHSAAIKSEDGNTEYSVFVVGDITERKAAQNRLNLVLEISNTLRSTLDVKALLTLSLSQTVNAISGADRGMIYLLDEQRALVPQASVGWKHTPDSTDSTHPCRVLSVKVLETDQPVLLKTTQEVGEWAELRRYVDESAVWADLKLQPVQSVISTTLQSHLGDSIGVISICSTRASFSHEDLKLLQAIAAEVAMAMGNAALFEDVKQHARQLEEKSRQQHRTELALQESNRQLQKALDELKLSQRQIIQHERMRALGQLASGIAHDLNNTLSPILGYAGLLLLEDSLSEKTRSWLKMIETGAADSAAVLERLRVFYRPVSDTTRDDEVHLAELVRQVVELTRPKWRDEAQKLGTPVDVITELSEVRPIVANATELREALINMVFNAIDAMPGGGTLYLRLGSENGHAVLELQDTGIGMTEEQAQKCFEPFYTSKGPQGTGLGLSICHGTVNSLGGWIDVETAPGAGASFKLYLPYQPVAFPSPGELAEVTLPRLRILYIDDDSRVRQVIAEMLNQLGQRVDLAEGGEQGIAKMRKGSYDLVITDLGMDTIDGMSVTRFVRSRFPETPVVMLTGWGDLAVVEQHDESARPDRLLQKPPSLDRLRRMILELGQND